MDDDQQQRRFSEAGAAPGIFENEEETSLFSSDIPNVKGIQEVLDEIRCVSENTQDSLKNLLNEFINKNKNFIYNISTSIDNIIRKYGGSKLNEKPVANNVNYLSEDDAQIALEKYSKSIKRICEVYSQLFNSLRQNYEIMIKFLNINSILERPNPSEDFFSQEFNNIVDCWMFMKIDFDKFNINEAIQKSKVDQNFKNFIKIVSKNKNLAMKIICQKFETFDPNEQKKQKEKKEENIKFLADNKDHLIKLVMKNVGNVSTYIQEKYEFPKLKNFTVENSIIQKGFKNMKSLEKLTIKSCLNFPIELIGTAPNQLKKLYLEKNNFVNHDFENIFKGILANNTNILEHLELLSFAGNNLTKTDLSIISSKIVFISLKELNFQKNKIYKFIYNPENFLDLKFINCCKNNLNKSYLSDIKHLGSLESANGFLFQPELSEKYYSNLKTKIKDDEKELYISDYLNVSYMPKVQTLKFFEDFIIAKRIEKNLKKLDLSYNSLDCTTFFKFASKNNGLNNLKILNLNGNEIDDTFFEKFLELGNNFGKLQHLYLNSNKIGDVNVQTGYRDEIPIDKKYATEKDKNLVYKLRLIYKFIKNNKCLNKLTITKNPISEFYSVVPEPNNDADKSNKYIVRDEENKIIINCLFSLLVKIRNELISQEEEKESRGTFNLRFDCRSNVNKNSENYPYSDKPITYKNK